MPRDHAFRLALVIERRARADADAWSARILQQGARLLARGRAHQVINPTAESSDPLRTNLMREWYVRVFEDHALRGASRLPVAAGPGRRRAGRR